MTLFDGTYLVRGWSDTSSPIAPNPNAGGEPLKAALRLNNRPAPPTGVDAVAALDVAAGAYTRSHFSST